MNKTISLAAIAMVAVVMGMSAFAPAMAVPPNPDSEATAGVCHLYSDNVWRVLYSNSEGRLNGHVNGHGDEMVPGEISAVDCDLKNFT